jgi:hypothetical protein
MRREPVKISKENPVRNDELKIFHVPVGMGRRRMVIEHQQDTRRKKNDEKEEGDRAQIIRGPHAEGFLSNLDWQPVEEKIAEDGEAARAIGIRGPSAENGLPDSRFAKALQCGVKSRSHCIP